MQNLLHILILATVVIPLTGMDWDVVPPHIPILHDDAVDDVAIISCDDFKPSYAMLKMSDNGVFLLLIHPDKMQPLLPPVAYANQYNNVVDIDGDDKVDHHGPAVREWCDYYPEVVKARIK